MKESIEIFDLVAQAPVEAELVDEVTAEDFLNTQLEWRPVVLEAARELVRLRRMTWCPDTSIGIGREKRRNWNF